MEGGERVSAGQDSCEHTTVTCGYMYMYMRVCICFSKMMGLNIFLSC